MIRWCKHCVLPDTRPDLKFGEDGICVACKTHSQRETVDWTAREKAFREVVTRSKARSKGYDCLIPVSGGKDSIWQTRTCLEYGLTPLTVTWKPPIRTEIGKKNLNALIALGVDHIDYTISPDVTRKLTLDSFEQYGNLGIAMHLGVFNIAHTIATKFKIPLVVWGENPATEYGGSSTERTEMAVTEELMKRRSIAFGTTAEDWVGEGLSRKNLTAFFPPTAQELEGVFAIFLGYYFPWDPETSLRAALQVGFNMLDKPKIGYYAYADLDDDMLAVHHWLKWYRFGFTRLFDHLSLEIRNNRMSREQALNIIREYGEQRPTEEIDLFCSVLQISHERFFTMIEKFRNREIWKKKNSTWMIENFIIDDWKWD